MSAPKPSRGMPTRAGTYMRRDPDWERTGWTSTPNALSRDPNIDWDAKGAYTWIASHLELEFPISAEALADAGPRGRDHAYGMVKTLEQHGWLTRERYKAADGRGTVHVWTLKNRQLPPEARTWKPSRATPRPSRLPAADSATAVELPAVQEFPHRDRDEPESAGQGGTPGRPGTPAGNPERPGPGRPGFPYKEEKTKGENQGGTTEVRHEREGTPDAAPPAPSSPLRADWTKPDTCLCAEHLALVAADPGADIPACRRCARVREWGKAKRAEHAELLTAEAAAVANRETECAWHDDAGWLVDPDTGLAFEPAVRCTHHLDPREYAAQVVARQAPPAPASSPEAREAAMRVLRRPRPSAAAGSRVRDRIPRARGGVEAARRAVREQVAERARAAAEEAKGGLDGAQPDGVDHSVSAAAG